MIQFNELKINYEGTKLIIDVSVMNVRYYEDVYIDSISIDTQDTFIDGGPSDRAIYTKTFEGNNKSALIELSEAAILSSLTNNLFFVYVKTKGTPSANTPCGEDNTVTLGATFYPYNMYCDMLKVFKSEYSGICNPPKKFIDYYLRYKALLLSLLAGNSLKAIEYFNGLVNPVRVSDRSNCRCYGS